MNANYNAGTIADLAHEVGNEVLRAGQMFPPMNSPHEAAFVIEEEWEEYRQEVFKHNLTKPNRDTRPRQREELIQLAAMCLRAILDTVDVPVGRGYHDQGNAGFGESTQLAINEAQASLREFYQEPVSYNSVPVIRATCTAADWGY
jgi:hypothetical protein